MPLVSLPCDQLLRTVYAVLDDVFRVQNVQNKKGTKQNNTKKRSPYLRVRRAMVVMYA